MTYAHPDHLISTADLAEAIQTNADNLLIFDATVNLVPAAKGYKAVSGLEDYQKGHVPGAAFLDLIHDLSNTASSFGFTLPSDSHLQAAYRAAGINAGSQVVIYSTGHMMWATRAWWMLYSCGHTNVAVLDGGFAKWTAEARPVSDQPGSYGEGDFAVTLDPARWADKTKVIEAINDAGTCTINALSPDVYSGEAAHSYGRKGHIENSRNVFYGDVLDKGCFKSAEDLKTLFTEKGVLDNPHIIAYCGGGISATIDALALTLIGHPDVAVYDGSMSEWASDETLPLITGDAE